MMDPVCFTLFGWPIYWYGIMMLVAFLVALAHLAWLGRREGRPPGMASEFVVWIMFAGILGARVAYVLGNLRFFLESPGEIIRLDHGGLAYYGGFTGAALAVMLFARFRRVPLWALADWITGALPLAHAIGRVGCFLNGCCYGRPSQAPWAVFSHDALRQPVQLYEAAFNVALYGLLLWAWPRRRRDGDLLALYLVTYPVGRFLLEFLRGDERLHWLGLNVAQDYSLLLLALGVALWLSPRPARSFAHGAADRPA